MANRVMMRAKKMFTSLELNPPLAKKWQNILGMEVY